MDEDKEKQPRSILSKSQTSDSIPRKTGNISIKEPTSGILRVDCGRSRRSSAGFVDFRGVPQRLTSSQKEPPSPQPSVDRLSVTFAERTDWSGSSVKINIFDPGSPPSRVQEMEKVRFSKDPPGGDEEQEEDDYSASVSAIMQRRESMKRASSKKKKRRESSPLPDADGASHDARRRSSEYTNSSGETAISIENETTQEQIFENIRLHKEVLSSVKLQPWGMRRKIKLVQQAKAYVKRHEGELQERLAMSKSTKDILARFNIWLIKELQFVKRELANTMTLLIPWELRIKEIESHFGSAVASYFTFLRWMFWVNLVITIVLACFVAIPEMLTADVKSAGERKEMLPEEKLTSTNLVTLWDFGGVLKYSPIFYGYYTNRDRSGSGYRLPFAYFMTGLAVYVYSFVATLRRMAENSRMSKLSEKDDECVFTWKIFTGWDYMIGNAETAHNRVASLILGFKEALLEETERKKDEKNWKVICLRVVVSFVVIGLLAFSAYVVFVVVERSTQPEANDSWWRQNEITVSVSIISLLFPFFFEILGLLEGYHPRKSLRIQLARIMVLNLLNLYTLIFSQFWKISDMTIELQSLKKNYSTFMPVTGSSLLNASGSVCVFVATDCSAEPSALEISTPLVPAAPTAYGTAIGLNISETGDIDRLATRQTYINGSEIEPIFLTTGVADEYSNATMSDWTSGNERKSGKVFSASYSEPAENESNISTTPNLSTIPDDNFEKSAISSGGDFSLFPNYSKDIANFSNDLSNSSFLFWNDSDYKIQVPKFDDNGTTEFFLDGTETTTTSAKLIDGSIPNICYVKKCEGLEDPGNSKTFHPVYDMETRKRLRTLCWETMFGQELVKLTVMDLILTILSVLLIDFFRAIFVRVMNNCWCWDLEKKFPQYGDFKIAENILHLVYNQGMVWMGMFFSPGLPAINLIKLAIMMYLRSWAVLTCNVPHEVVFRASRSNNFYLALLLTMLFLCVLPVGFAIVWIEPSWHCGPFSDYERIYHLFTKTLQKALPKTLHKAFDYLASPGIIIPLLMLLVLIIYYLVSLTNALREANNDLKIQLRRERTEERRKMFQLVNKRGRKESKDSETPLSKWRKLLPELAARQLTLTNDPDKEDKNEIELDKDPKKEINRKELLTRIMKKALKKPSEDALTNDIAERAERGDDQNSMNSNEKPTGQAKTFKSSEKPKPGSRSAKPQAKVKVQKIRERIPGETEKTGTPFQSTQPENIPVIKISKIESDEQLPKSDQDARNENPKKGLARFIAAVERYLTLTDKEKDSMNRQLDGAEDEAKRTGGEQSPGVTPLPKGDTARRMCPIATEEVIPSELNVNAET